MRKLYVVLAILITVNVSVAQQVNQSSGQNTPLFFNPPAVNDAYQQMVQKEMAAYVSGRGGADTPQDQLLGLDYDVKYYKLDLRINPDSIKYVRGNITTYFTTRQANFNLIKFDFASPLLCDSVYYNGARLAAGNVVKSNDTLRISIPAIAAAGTLDSVKVYYRGVPPNVNDLNFATNTGYVKSSVGADNYIYTLSEPYSASNWWPCKAKVAADKADSVDIIVSTPSAFRVAANGKRISETITGTQRLSIWKHRYPISSYQVALAVAKYTQYPATPAIVNIGGTNMELYNLIFTGTLTTGGQTALDRTAEMLTVFSDKFGDYPFKLEKYGHYSFGFGGGMEHNTFSGMGSSTYDASSDWSVIAHELGHQWFGAAVTCGSWRDIWVNESFARYSEVVFAEFKNAATLAGTTGLSHRAGLKTTAMRTASPDNQAHPIYQTDTTTMTDIFVPSVAIYDRGAMFISMLRKTLGDTKFFQAIRNYQTDPALQYKNAFTDDVKRHMEAVSGLDLSEMFNDWIYHRGFARYNGAQWNNVGNQVVLYMPQTSYMPAEVTHFDAPIVIRFSRTSPAQDTTIVLFDKQGVLQKVNNGVFTSGGANMIQIALPFTPTTIAFDPDSETLIEGSFTKNAALSLLSTNVLDFSGKKEDKNVKLLLTIDQSNDYASFEIERSFDGASFTKIGTRLASQNAGATSFTYVDHNVPSGVLYYRIKVVDRDGSHIYTKTITISSKNGTLYTVTPNPAKDFILIGHNEAATAVVNVKIVDAKGRIILNQAKKSITANSKLRVELTNIAAGNYYVEIENENKDKVVEKIVVVR